MYNKHDNATTAVQAGGSVAKASIYMAMACSNSALGT